MKTANVKNKPAKVKVKIFGQEIETFGITSDDKTITSDVITDYKTMDDVLSVLFGASFLDNGIMTFDARVER